MTQPSSLLVPPAERKTLKDEVVRAIQQAIVSGTLKPGDRVIEAEIASQMGVSHTPIREAIRQLEEAGLLVSVPHKGAQVTSLSVNDVREITSLRVILEGFAARLAAPRFTDADRDRMAALIDEMRAGARRGDLVHLVRHDLEFHRHLWRLSRHRRLMDTLTRLSIPHFIFVTSKAIFENLGEMADVHLSILEALALRDADLAEGCLKKHIAEYGERLALRLSETS